MDEGGESIMSRKKTKGKKNKKKKNPRQIPAFGNWDMAIANDLPITQYFDSALQAGLVRYSSSSSSNYNNNNHSADFHQGHGYGKVEENKKTKTNANVIEGGRKQVGNNGKVFDVTVTEIPPLAATAAAKRRQTDAVKKVQQHRRAPKAVDEDLYKIPPELIKRKRRLGFFSRCLVPSCAV